MTTHTRLRLGAGAFVLAALIFVLLASAASRLCNAALDAVKEPGMRPFDGTALACAEFWLNRYQSLLSGVLSLCAALIGAYLIWRQLAGMRDANEISRKAQAVSQYSSVSARYLAIQESVVVGQKIQHAAGIINTAIPMLRSVGNWNEEIDSKNRDVIEACTDVLRYANKMKSDLKRGIDFPNQILQMEFNCDWAIRAAREYKTFGIDGAIQRNRIETANLYEITSKSMMANSIDFFHWMNAEENRLKTILRHLDKVIIG